ncbi:MAG: Dephospho-CoA kinase [Bacteroidota bacterium]|nr:MAG: Dephospho-CoA kinase [Bacteroidota bacterium]
MKHYVLTGGIGSGKSTILELFKKMDVPTFSADDSAKYVMQHNPEVKKKIKALFGKSAYNDGILNRKWIAEQVFNDKVKLDKLNKEVHPAAKAAYTKWQAKQNAPYTIYEFPIVFELNAQGRFDGVILITAPEKKRIQRVQNRDNVSEDAVQARISNQWTDEQKVALADFVIENIELSNTISQVKALHEKLLKNSN